MIDRNTSFFNTDNSIVGDIIVFITPGIVRKTYYILKRSLQSLLRRNYAEFI